MGTATAAAVAAPAALPRDRGRQCIEDDVLSFFCVVPVYLVHTLVRFLRTFVLVV